MAILLIKNRSLAQQILKTINQKGSDVMAGKTPKKGQNRNNGAHRVSNVPSHRQKEVNKVNGGIFVFTKALTVSELSQELNISVADIIKTLFMAGKMVTINTTLDDELIGQICLEFGFDFKKKKSYPKKILKN